MIGSIDLLVEDVDSFLHFSHCGHNTCQGLLHAFLPREWYECNKCTGVDCTGVHGVSLLIGLGADMAGVSLMIEQAS